MQDFFHQQYFIEHDCYILPWVDDEHEIHRQCRYPEVLLVHGTNHNAKPNQNNNHYHGLEFGPMKSYTLKIKAQTNTNRFLVGVSCDLLATLVLFLNVCFLRFHPVLQRQDTGYGGMPRLLLCLGQMLDRSFQLPPNCWIDGWLSGRWSWRRTIRLCKANLTLDFDGMLAR